MPGDVRSEIEIDRQRAEVAAYAGDLDNATSGYQNIKSVQCKTPRPVAVGSQIASVAEFLRRRLATELVPSEHFVMRTAEGPFPIETTYTWADSSSGATRMTLRNRGAPSGLARIAGAVMASAMRARQPQRPAQAQRDPRGQLSAG